MIPISCMSSLSLTGSKALSQSMQLLQECLLCLQLMKQLLQHDPDPSMLERSLASLDMKKNSQSTRLCQQRAEVYVILAESPLFSSYGHMLMDNLTSGV